MALRFDDVERVLTLSVHDLVDAGPARGHLLPRMGSGTARMALGREVHADLQRERAGEDARYEACLLYTSDAADE